MSRRRKAVPRPVIHLLKHVNSALRIALDEALAETGLTAAQVAVLSSLRSEPALSNADLARLAFVKPQSMVPLLKELEAQGWIVRKAHPAGGRSMPARLTAQGARQLQVGWAAVKAVEDRMTAGLTRPERLQLRTMLESCLAGLAGPARDAPSAAPGRKSR